MSRNRVRLSSDTFMLKLTQNSKVTFTNTIGQRAENNNCECGINNLTQQYQ